MRLGEIFAVLLVTAMACGCSNETKAPAAPLPKIDGDSVTFAPGSPQLSSLGSAPVAQRRPAAATLNGKLTWDEDKTVRIYTPLAGRVGRILAQPGDRVQAGQVLAEIASPDFGQAQAETRRAQGDYALAQQSLTRVKDLHQNGVAPAKDLHAAEADYARADSELKRTQARLKLYGGGSEIDQTYALKSPLAGAVVEKNINPGQELRPDQMAGAPAQFVITNPSYLWVLLDASEKDLPQLKIGKTIAIGVPAYANRTFEAKVAAVADFLDPVTRTIKVRATLDNSQRLLKGEMFVTALLGSDAGAVLQVPSRAVFFQGGRHFVFVDGGNGNFLRTEVKTGEVSEGSVTVLAGLQPGQKVVTDGALLLQQLLQPRRVVK